ncbi:hypothetical protein OSTOST_20440 [Ostertagia ostertagi]
MVLSWSIFISTAILFARHMKGHCPNSALCGLQLWFHNNQWGSVHAMLGLIACVVAWAQPLNAVFRCHPDGKGRILFNIIHGFFGFGCWLCAASATMIAVVHFRMFSDRDAALGIYIAFVAVAGLTCIVMELLTFKSTLVDRTASRLQTRHLQVFILLFFVVVAIGTAVAISVLIGKKPIA